MRQCVVCKSEIGETPANNQLKNKFEKYHEHCYLTKKRYFKYWLIAFIIVSLLCVMFSYFAFELFFKAFLVSPQGLIQIDFLPLVCAIILFVGAIVLFIGFFIFKYFFQKRLFKKISDDNKALIE